MIYFLNTLHIILCFGLILVILLQPGKDGASVFGGGGGGNQMYGPRGQANLLTKVTTLGAALFMFTSISLAWFSNEATNAGSNLDDALERRAEKEGFKRTSATGANIQLGAGITAPPAPVPATEPPAAKVPAAEAPAAEVPAAEAAPPSAGSADGGEKAAPGAGGSEAP
jgi:preprotein translocase subunit SecG